MIEQIGMVICLSCSCLSCLSCFFFIYMLWSVKKCGVMSYESGACTKNLPLNGFFSGILSLFT